MGCKCKSTPHLAVEQPQSWPWAYPTGRATGTDATWLQLWLTDPGCATSLLPIPVNLGVAQLQSPEVPRSDFSNENYPLKTEPSVLAPSPSQCPGLRNLQSITQRFVLQHTPHFCTQDKRPPRASPADTSSLHAAFEEADKDCCLVYINCLSGCSSWAQVFLLKQKMVNKSTFGSSSYTSLSAFLLEVFNFASTNPDCAFSFHMLRLRALFLANYSHTFPSGNTEQQLSSERSASQTSSSPWRRGVCLHFWEVHNTSFLAHG